MGASSRRDRYLKRGIYIHTLLAAQFREAALVEGFRLGDFARILIFAGLMIHLLRFDDREWAANTRLHMGFQELRRGLGGPAKRCYAPFRHLSRSGSWITVSLPVGYVTFVDQFARVRGLSRNEALHSLLETGLLGYLEGRTLFLKAIVDSTEKTNSAAGS